MGVKVEDDDVISIKVGDNTGSFHLPATEGALWQLFHGKKVWIFSNISAIKQWQFVTVECIVYSNFFFFVLQPSLAEIKELYLTNEALLMKSGIVKHVCRLAIIWKDGVYINDFKVLTKRG